MLGVKPDLRQSTILFSPPTPSYPPSTTLLLPSLAALHQCPVPLETLVRHPRRVVHTYEDLRLTILGLCSPTPPHARVSWGLAVAVAISVFCNRRFSHTVVVCVMRLFASCCAAAFALTNFSPTPWAPLEHDTPPPLPSLPASPDPHRSSVHQGNPLHRIDSVDLVSLSDAPDNAAAPSVPPPPDPSHSQSPPVASRLTYDSLSFGTLNVGGTEITQNRLCHLLSGFCPLSYALALQEYRPCSTSHPTDHERVARFWGYHMVISAPNSRDGVALLVHTSVSPQKPLPTVHIPGILISVELSLHTDPSVPAVRVASFYGPHRIKDKHTCEPVLDPLLSRNFILLGDLNAVTEASHTTALKPNIWPWLVAKERSSALSDLLLPHSPHTPYTRVHRYGGSKSYIDRVYGSRQFCALFQPSAASVLDFSRVPGAQDHDPVVVSTVPWTVPHTPHPRCALWNRRDVKRFQREMDTPSPHADSPVTPESVHTVYQSLTRRMLEAMRVVNDSRAPTREPDWASVVKQLAKQAKRRSKLFYRRVKDSVLSPPAQSTLPVPTGKIQRILQRNTPWSEDAASLIRRVERLHYPPPPTLPELRSLAKAARKKSPGPDGVPPYLLYILPDSAFSVVHSCLVTCYESGTLPREWLVSETFCLFKGQGKWQDPDRWRPIAMNNSIYRLLM